MELLKMFGRRKEPKGREDGGTEGELKSGTGNIEAASFFPSHQKKGDLPETNRSL